MDINPAKFDGERGTERADSEEGATPKTGKQLKMPKSFVVEDFRESMDGVGSNHKLLKNYLDNDIDEVGFQMKPVEGDRLQTPLKAPAHRTDNNFFAESEEGKEVSRTPSPSGLSKFNIKALPLDRLTKEGPDASHANTVFNSPKTKGFDKLSTNAKFHNTLMLSSDAKNKVFPFNMDLEG